MPFKTKSSMLAPFPRTRPKRKTLVSCVSGQSAVVSFTKRLTTYINFNLRLKHLQTTVRWNTYRLPAQSCTMKIIFLTLALLTVPSSAELCGRTGDQQCEPHSGKCLDAVLSGVEGTASPRVISRLFKYGKYCGGAEKSCPGANNANAAPSGVVLVPPDPCVDERIGVPNGYDVACRVREHKWNYPLSY
jgi:hypothetical protein